MKRKLISVILTKQGNDEGILFKLGEDKFLNFNSDDQKQIQDVFYHLMELIVSNTKVRIKLVLDNSNKDDVSQLIQEIAIEYIKQLNNEIESIYRELPNLNLENFIY